MNYTNKLGLPQYIVDWLLADDYNHNYDPYTISATTLMKPTRAHLLTIRHRDQLETDASDIIAARVGTALHDSISVVKSEGYKKEERASREIQLESVTYKITGKYDILQDNDDGTYSLRDIKTTSVWARILGGKDEGYCQQLSVYRWLLNGQGLPVTDIGYIDFFFTDWQSAKAKTDKDYPKHKVYTGHAVQLMSLEKTEEWIKSRLELIEKNKNLADENLQECTREELWAGVEKFAVMKRGGKRATKLCDTKEEAEEYIKTKQIAGYVQYRPPKVRRCNYCPGLPFCNQGISYQKQGLLT